MANLLSELCTRNLWLTGVAMLRYLPRAIQHPPVDGMDFFSSAKLSEYQSRIASLTPTSAHCWGTMTVDQWLHHLNIACGYAHGFYTIEDESYLASRTLFRWILVDWYSEQPVGLRLPKGFKLSLDQHFDFYAEQAQLLRIIEAVWNKRSANEWGPHCMFGRMSLWEWGKLLQIHIDYHLRQFGA